ncbi:MAG: hypothetical protein ACTHY0_02255 [Mammaliicoccus vitulinus]
MDKDKFFEKEYKDKINELRQKKIDLEEQLVKHNENENENRDRTKKSN